MRLKIKHFDKKVFESKMQHLKDIDFTLFVDDIPQSESELTDLNILVLQEPNEYFGLHDWAIKNQDLFSVILTWDNKVLNNCEQAVLLPFGHTWMTPHFWNKSYDKKFQVSHLAGALNKTYGHSLRHELLDRKNEIGNMDKVFHHTYGNRNDIEDARAGKVDIFGNSQYGVAIENTSHRGYFTEKILDLLLLKTIPVYWGCSNIEKYFNTAGIIRVENVDDMIYQVNDLNPQLYDSMSDIIEENFQSALKYVDYEQRIVDYITKVFKENNII